MEVKNESFLDDVKKTIILAFVFAVTFMSTTVVMAVNWRPTSDQSLSSFVPEMSSTDCKNIHMTALTPTLVASGTALHLKKFFDVSAANSQCWCIFSSGESAATGTGRHFPAGAIITLRFSALYFACSCDAEAIMTTCPNNI